MRTLIIFAIVLVSPVILAQVVPDFNTKMKSNITQQPGLNDIKTSENTSKELFPIASELQVIMENHLSISDGKIDKIAAKEFSKINKAQIQSIEEKRECAKILVREEDNNNPCFIPQEKYNETMVSYLQELEERKLIDEFLTSIYTEKTESPLIYDKGRTTVSIPPRLQNDMKLLMNIKGPELDAYAAAKYHEIAVNKKNKLVEDQAALKLNIADDGLPLSKNHEEFKNNAALIQRYRVLSSFFYAANTLGGKPKLFWTRFFPVKNTMSARYFFLDNNEEENVMFINKVGIQTDFSSSFSANANVITGVLCCDPIFNNFS